MHGLTICIVFEILTTAWILWMIWHEERMITWERAQLKRLRRRFARARRRLLRNVAARYWTRRGYVVVAYRPAVRRQKALWTVEKREDAVCTTRK